ncbi:hypothetical protein QTP88_019817 [Uroleucon formosanum]
MFCHSEDGYSIDIPLYNSITKLTLEKKVSTASFYAYQIMITQDEINRILNFIRNRRKQLRAENYIHLKDAAGRNDVNATDIGQMVVLPSSFAGGPLYMHESTQDAMTYVRVHGRPDLFITFTCNPTWKDCFLGKSRTFVMTL